MSKAICMTTDNTPKKETFENGKWVWEDHYPEGLDWNINITNKPLTFVLEQAIKKFPNNSLCDFLGKSFSYKEVGQYVDKVAKGLQNIGVTKGTKVGIFLPNTPYSIIFFYGILKAGGTVVNYNPLYVEHELINQIEDSETDIIVTIDLKLTLDKLKNILSEIKLKKIVVCKMIDVLPFPKNIYYPIYQFTKIAKIPKDDYYIKFKDLIDNGGNPQSIDINPDDDIAVLQYTGGTTGIPKAAMLTHSNLYSNVQQTTRWIRNIDQGSDIMIGVLPLFHVFAMTVVMNCSIWSGLKIILHPNFIAQDILDSIKKHKPAFFPAVPAIFNILAKHKDIKTIDFSSLKFCMSGGAPLPNDVKRLFEENTGCSVLGEGYGLTETSPVSTFSPSGGKIKSGSVGMPIPGTIIEIIDRDDGVTVLAIGEKGEVCISGAQVMKGYFNKEAETADVCKNGRFHTGDVGYLDEEGYLFLVDRIKDMIMVRGYNVYPRIVEEAIYKHSAVEEAIVAGVPDEVRGETVWAWIKPINGKEISIENLKEFLKDKISPIEMPRKIIIRDEPLPKTAVGKLSKKALLEQEGIKRNKV